EIDQQRAGDLNRHQRTPFQLLDARDFTLTTTIQTTNFALTPRSRRHNCAPLKNLSDRLLLLTRTPSSAVPPAIVIGAGEECHDLTTEKYLNSGDLILNGLLGLKTHFRILLLAMDSQRV